jgi:hypothetical protein
MASSLKIRIPTNDVLLLVEESKSDEDLFKRAVKMILHHLVKLSHSHPPDQKNIRYFTSAFHAFLRAKGGNYSVS